MLYVFDDAQEMGECCGCALTVQLATFSAAANLTANWALETPEGINNETGAIAIVAASLNPNLLTFGSPSNGHFCTVGQSGACNFGCDPTNRPGYVVTTANNLLGSITHLQLVGPDAEETMGITEVALSDDGGGDPNNLSYLQNQCGALVAKPWSRKRP